MATGSSDDDIALASAPALRISTAASSSDAATSLLIGIYKKLEKPGRFDEPAFENARTAMFLYQQSPGTWCIGSRLGGTSYRALKLPGALLGEGEWSAFDGSLRKSFESITLSAAVCDLEAEHEAGLSPSVVALCRFDNVAGLYRLNEDDSETELNCRVGQYYNAEDDKILWHNAKKGCWMISDPSGVPAEDGTGKFSAFVNSAKCNADTSPELADWTGKTHLLMHAVLGNEQMERAAREAEEKGKYVDEDFPAEAKSIGDKIQLPKGNTASDVRWIRAQALLPAGEVPALFNKIEPDDILQGALGDCWLLAAIAAVAEFPNYIEQELFVTRTLDGEGTPGKYSLRLFDASKGGGDAGWSTVTVDDRIPCDPRKAWFDYPTPLFAKNHGAEMYVMLLEKAFAKFSGSYSSLLGGAASRAWIAMTGCLDVRYFEFESSAGAWTQSRVDTKPDAVPLSFWGKKVLRGQAIEKSSGGSKGQLSAVEMCQQLRTFDESNYLMAVSISTGAGGVEHKRPDGLIEGHAYSLIHVREVKLSGSAGKVTLLMLRNPWGNHDEWSGAWSDKSDEWANHPNVAAELEFTPKADGLFWMAWEDFQQTFNQIEVCCKEMPTLRGAFDNTTAGRKLRPVGLVAAAGSRKKVIEVDAKPWVPKPQPKLPKPGMRLKHNIMLPPVSATSSPYELYLEQRKSYLEACEKAEAAREG